MKNKGFVLMETIVVIVVISVALLTIFSSYNKILRKLKTENKYDTSEYIYMTNYVKDYLRNHTSCSKTIYEMGKDDSGVERNKPLQNYFSVDCGFSSDEVNNLSHPFGIKRIYLLQYLTEVDEDSKKDLEKFDAYMIDYIRKLDVGVNDTLIVVEYERPALNSNGSIKEDSLGNKLYETYIASLEW